MLTQTDSQILQASALGVGFVLATAILLLFSRRARDVAVRLRLSYPLGTVAGVISLTALAMVVAFVIEVLTQSTSRRSFDIMSAIPLRSFFFVGGWYLFAHGYIGILAAVATISYHPWAEPTDRVTERIGQVRRIYPDWRYLINVHYRSVAYSIAFGGGLMFFGEPTFLPDTPVSLVVSGVTTFLGLVLVFVAFPVILGLKGKVKTRDGFRESAKNPNLVDDLTRVIEGKDPSSLSLDAQKDSRRDAGGQQSGWASKTFGAIVSTYEAILGAESYLPIGNFGTVGTLVVGAVMFPVLILMTQILTYLLSPFGFSQSTVAAYVAVWLFVSFWVLIPVVYFFAKLEGE